MTTEELHKILDDENKKISIKDFKEILFELKSDAFNELSNTQHFHHEHDFYNGELNAFQIALDLSEHINSQAEQIRSLEEQLKNAIVPKFKSQDVAWRIHWYTNEIERVVIVSTRIEIVVGSKIYYTIAILNGEDTTLANLNSKFFENINSYIDQVKEDELFATREEALKRLAELEGK